MQQKQRTLYLDVARTVAIISISLNHAVNRVYSNYSGTMEEFQTISLGSTLFKTLVIVFSRLGVPIFLMITGALLLNKKMESGEDVKRFYRHNLLPLLVTSEIWYFLMFWFTVFLDPSLDYIAELGGIGPTILACLKTMLFLDQITLGSMWYIPMILCLYLLIPLLAMVIKKLSISYMWPPILIVFLSGMVIPAINSYFTLAGEETSYSFALAWSQLFSIYFLYVLAGYFVANGGLSRLPTWLVAALCLLCYGGSCGYQFWAFSRPEEYLVSYYFPGVLLATAFLVEMIRRKAELLRQLRGIFGYISRISFGIYFVHIIIMQSLFWHLDYSQWHRSLAVIFLEAVSVLGAILVIWLLARFSVFKKYVFRIK